MVFKPEESEEKKTQDNFAENSNSVSNENSKPHFTLDVQSGTIGTNAKIGGK